MCTYDKIFGRHYVHNATELNAIQINKETDKKNKVD